MNRDRSSTINPFDFWNVFWDHYPVFLDGADISMRGAKPLEKVVIHFKSGNILKGLAREPKPGMDHCAVIPDVAENDLALMVSLERTKGIFFVKNFDGRMDRRDRRRFDDGNYASARKSMITFDDGEILYGYTRLTNFPGDPFWLVPSDTGSNNERVLIHPSSVSRIRFARAARESHDSGISLSPRNAVEARKRRRDCYLT